MLPNKIEQLDLLKLQKKITKYANIYSDEGIFRIQQEIIHKLTPKDICIENIEYNNIDFIIDRSYYIFSKDTYTIPYNHIISNIEYIEYKLTNKSNLILVIEKCIDDNSIVDIYFLINENVLYDYYKNDIIEIISLIKNIKQS